MARRRLGAAIIGMTLILTVNARAGIYNTAEMQRETVSPNYRFFQESLILVRQFGNAETDPPPHKRAALAAALAEPYVQRRARADFTSDQYLILSAYLIRLGKHDEAIEFLNSAVQEFPDHFLLNSNLATAYHLKGEKERAKFYLRSALRRWPEKMSELTPKQKSYLKSAGWHEQNHQRYRRAEEYLLNWITRDFNAGIPEIVTAVFSKDGSPINFVSDNGEYKPGEMAKTERDKLPDDALLIAEQLLLWYPHDNRTIWMVAELLNARGQKGDVQQAAKLMNELVQDRKEGSQIVRRHRQILNFALKSQAKTDSKLDPDLATSDKKNGNDPPPVTESIVLNPWQMLGVGFLAGAVVFLFGSWQIRMLARRR